MTRYFYGGIEGEAPDELSEAEIREAINEGLPDWAEASLTRVDE